MRIEDLTDEDVAHWLLQKGGMSLVISGKQLRDASNALSITKRMSGRWSVAFHVLGTEIPLDEDILTFETIDGPRIVPLTAEAKASLERLIAACKR